MNIGGVALSGTDESGERFAILTTQYPEMQAGFSGPVPKELLERLHLHRFAGDYLLQHGTLPFEGHRPGEDPPDFVVDTSTGPEALDCVVFPLQDWRLSYRLFSRFMERLQTAHRDHDLSGLAGCDVGIYFGQTSGTPPRRSDDELIEPLLTLMDGERVDHAKAARVAQQAATSGFPDQFPTGIMAGGRLPDGEAGFFANPVYDPAVHDVPKEGPLTVGLHKTEHFTISQARELLQRLVSKHDKPEIQHLLVTAGGPDRDGLRYPGEEMLAHFVIEQPDLHVNAIHLKRVTLHLWGQASIHDVTVVAPHI